jgi:hypothetical protein
VPSGGKGNAKTYELSKKKRLKEAHVKSCKSGIHVENKKLALKVGEKRSCHAVEQSDFNPKQSNEQPMAEGEEEIERKRFRAAEEDSCVDSMIPAETAMQSRHSQ